MGQDATKLQKVDGSIMLRETCQYNKSPPILLFLDPGEKGVGGGTRVRQALGYGPSYWCDGRSWQWRRTVPILGRDSRIPKGTIPSLE